MSRVLRSADDQLFLIGDTNDVLRLYDADGFAALMPVDNWRARPAEREAFFARLGIPWCLLLAPEKLSISGDAVLPAGLATPGARFIDRIEHAALVYPRDYLRRQREDGYIVYPRTDSHWTVLGAFSLLQWLAPILGLDLDYRAFLELDALSMSCRGDLWGDGHADFPLDAFERRAVPASITRIHANPVVVLKFLGLTNEAGLHVGSHIAFRHPQAQRRERLVLFGTSISEYRLEYSLLTFLAALFFREVHFVWSTDLDLDFIAALQPDIALLEMPERFLTFCPTDSFDLLSHAGRVVAGWRG
jgi:hypothetical protein